MNIVKTLESEKLTLAIEGRLDSSTAPDLEKVISSELTGIKELVMDFAELQYISSAGLRVLLQAQKIMNVNGSMVIKNVNETIMEVFSITGFSDILTIEQ